MRANEEIYTDLKKFAQTWLAGLGVFPPWQTTSMEYNLHQRRLSLEMTSITGNQQSIMKNMSSLVKPKFGTQL
jgi:hypothetical protein